MDVGLTETQLLMKRTARDFLVEACPTTRVREMEASGSGLDEALWRQFAEMGWLGVGLPADIGGEGGDIADLVVLAGEFGRALAPVPWLSTVVWGGHTLLDSGSKAAGQVLRRIPVGKTVLSVATRENDAGYGPSSISMVAEQHDAGWQLTGEKHFVADGGDASAFIVLCRSGQGNDETGLTAFLVESDAPGLKVFREPTVATTGADRVVFDQVRPTAVLGVIGAGWALLQRPTAIATTVLCAYMVGAAERSMELSIAYANERVQFGRPIGSFQAVSHKLADMRLKLDIAKLLTWKAARALDSGAQADSAVSMAKAWTNSATRWALYRCHEIFAGLGFMKIHDLQLYFRRLKLAESLLGDEMYHRRQVVNQAVLPLAVPKESVA